MKMASPGEGRNSHDAEDRGPGLERGLGPRSFANFWSFELNRELSSFIIFVNEGTSQNCNLLKA